VRVAKRPPTHVKTAPGPHDARRFPRLRHVGLDAVYNGKGKGKDWIERTLGWTAEIVAHPPRPKTVWVTATIPPEQIEWSKYLPPPGFRLLPRRRVVERMFAWQSQSRRLSIRGA
jgi:hypothetical protein